MLNINPCITVFLRYCKSFLFTFIHKIPPIASYIPNSTPYHRKFIVNICYDLNDKNIFCLYYSNLLKYCILYFGTILQDEHYS